MPVQALDPQSHVEICVLQMNAMSPSLFQGKAAKLTPEEFTLYVRERFLLYVKCIESKPGSEPTDAYLN
jgi:hypothetical protein